MKTRHMINPSKSPILNISAVCWWLINIEQAIILSSTTKLSTGNHEDRGTVK